MQLERAGQFQEYSPFVTDENPYTNKIDLSVVDTVPHTMFLAEEDQYCVHHSVSKKLYKEMGIEPKIKICEGLDHLWPITDVPDSVIENLIKELDDI